MEGTVSSFMYASWASCREITDSKTCSPRGALLQDAAGSGNEHGWLWGRSRVIRNVARRAVTQFVINRETLRSVRYDTTNNPSPKVRRSQRER